MRLEGWERRLLQVLEEAGARAYELGEHDCFRTTCRVIEALTGTDRWPEFAGRYRTRRQARKLLAEHGGSFEDAFDGFFGAPNVDTRQARRGDIVAIDDGKEKHLGVCLGVDTAYLDATGLLYVPTLACLCCWRVG